MKIDHERAGVPGAAGRRRMPVLILTLTLALVPIMSAPQRVGADIPAPGPAQQTGPVAASSAPAASPVTAPSKVDEVDEVDDTGERPPAAAAPDDPQARWETRSVRELMQLDLREAQQTASGSSASRQRTGPESLARPVLEPRLVALYGVGRALMAEVQVGRRAYLYVRGQAWPAGHVGDRGVYQLRGMNGGCVQLERGKDRHSLCLRMLLGETRP
ncbi:MAG: hypothetical protein ACK5JE_09500 [Castellaniella sp.]|uniref:hypothetical protein n=1 Tax=Castellaniella sp. TaxID=1955812 RepID=UPI003A844AC9